MPSRLKVVTSHSESENFGSSPDTATYSGIV